MNAMNALALPVLALLIAVAIIYVARNWLGKRGGRALSTAALEEEDDPNMR